MSRPVRGAIGAALAAVALLGIAAASQVPYPTEVPEHGVLRLSWRARGERVEECRHLSEAELAQLPPHMRRSEVCEGRVLPYLLYVEMDGATLLRETVHPAGARQDRPLYVFHEVPLPPGEHRLAVRFVREDARDAAGPRGHGGQAEREGRDGGDHGPDGQRGDRRGDHRGEAATPALLELEATLDMRAGEVTLVTYDPDRRELVARTPEPASR